MVHANKAGKGWSKVVIRGYKEICPVDFEPYPTPENTKWIQENDSDGCYHCAGFESTMVWWFEKETDAMLFALRFK